MQHPAGPMLDVARRPRPVGRGGDQPPDLRDGQRDHAGVRWRCLTGPDGSGRLGISTVLEQGGGDGADRQRGHHQDGVPADRGVKPDLGLVQPEVVLAELEVLSGRPAQPGGADAGSSLVAGPRGRGSSGRPAHRSGCGGGSAGDGAGIRGGRLQCDRDQLRASFQQLAAAGLITAEGEGFRLTAGFLTVTAVQDAQPAQLAQLLGSETTAAALQDPLRGLRGHTADPLLELPPPAE